MKYSKVFILSAFSALSVVILRFIQMTALTDAKTGFFLDGQEELGSTFSAAVIIVIAISSILVFLYKDGKINPLPYPNVILGITAILAGVSHIAEPLVSDADLANVPTALVGLRFVLIFISGIVFCWFGASVFTKNPFNPALCIVFVIAWIVRLMSTFISYTGMSNISENMYDTLMLMSTLVFMLAFGKALYGISKSKNNRFIISVGIMSVLCTVASSAPSLLYSLVSDTELIHKPIDSPITGIFTAAFITAYLFNICKNTAEE